VDFSPVLLHTYPLQTPEVCDGSDLAAHYDILDLVCAGHRLIWFMAAYRIGNVFLLKKGWKRPCE
jgi:hypothetical protein